MIVLDTDHISELQRGVPEMVKRNLEERVAVLEKKFSEFERLLRPQARKKDWLRTFGMFADDPGFEELVRLGREYRESQRSDADE